MDKALEGVKILDLSRVQAGPSCTQLLGFLGADVIKVEDTGGGDRTRWEMAHNEHDSVYFTIFNNNKQETNKIQRNFATACSINWIKLVGFLFN